MFKVELPREVDDRLTALSLRTGRTKSFYIREAILNHLDDIEDRFLALSSTVGEEDCDATQFITREF